jgi:multiple sugar transport system permease protein
VSVLGRIIVYVTCTILAALVLIPFVWALRIALQPTFTTAVPLIPDLSKLSLENFQHLLRNTAFPRWVLNSFVFAGFVTVFNVVLDAMAGYVLARRRLPGANVIFVGVLALLMVPHQITLIPLYLMMSELNLVDTYVGLILPLAANAFGIFVMRQFILSIPTDYEEAAAIDGASRIRTFFTVIFPLARPAALVVAVTVFVETWNNFIFPLVMVTQNHMKTVTVGLADFSYATLNVNWGLTMAGSLLGAVPAIVLFLLLQRTFMEGFSLGGGVRG